MGKMKHTDSHNEEEKEDKEHGDFQLDNTLYHAMPILKERKEEESTFKSIAKQCTNSLHGSSKDDKCQKKIT